MTSKDISQAIIGNYQHHLWSHIAYWVFPNSAQLGKGFNPEMDLAIVSKSGYCTEVEIKISAADFRKEFTEKKLKHDAMAKGQPISPYVKYFYFAIPANLLEKIESEIPEYAGIIVVHERDTANYYGLKYEAEIIRKPKVFKATKVPQEKIDNLIKSIYYRYWTQNTWKTTSKIEAWN